MSKQKLKLIKLKTTFCNRTETGPSGYAFRYEGHQYWCDKHVWEAYGTPYYDSVRQETLIFAKRDFGGCGDQAIKPEVVPFKSFLAEHCYEFPLSWKPYLKESL